MKNKGNPPGRGRRANASSKIRPRAARPERTTRSSRSSRNKPQSARRAEPSSVSLPRPGAPSGKQTAVNEQNARLGANLRQSLAATSAGLQKFVTSMRQSGMGEALCGYRNLQGVLLQQRRWADNNHHKDLMPMFREIADSAAELHRMFAGYAAIMAPLKAIGRVLPPTDAEVRAAATSVEAVLGPDAMGVGQPVQETPESAPDSAAASAVNANVELESDGAPMATTHGQEHLASSPGVDSQPDVVLAPDTTSETP